MMKKRNSGLGKITLEVQTKKNTGPLNDMNINALTLHGDTETKKKSTSYLRSCSKGFQTIGFKRYDLRPKRQKKK